jgi:predicted DsbA family dithiol-disulfide isomerase
VRSAGGIGLAALVALGRGTGEIQPAEQGGAVADRKLVLFADYVCPFCYLAEPAVARLERETGVAVERAAYELRPPGTMLPALDGSWMREAWHRSVEPLARALDVPIAYPRLMTRTRKAHEAVAHARTQEQAAGAAMHDAVYRAYWLDGRDIGRIDVLVEIGVAAGLDGAALRVALDIDQCAAAVEADAARGARLGLRGVPAYVLADGTDGTARIRTGLQRYDELKEWVWNDDV